MIYKETSLEPLEVMMKMEKNRMEAKLKLAEIIENNGLSIRVWLSFQA